MWKALRANWIALASSTLLLGAVFLVLSQEQNISTVLHVWRGTDKWPFAVAIVLTIAMQATPVWRLLTIMNSEGVNNVAFRSLFRIQLISLFVGHGAPISAIADLAKAAIVKLRFNLKSGQSVRVILYERICGALCAALFGLIASLILLKMSSLTRMLGMQLLLWTGGLLASGVLLGIGGLNVTTRIEFINRVVRAFITLGLMLRRPWVTSELLIASFLQLCGLAVIYFVLAIGMHIDVSLWHMLLFMPLIFFVSSLPIFYQGWGAREAIVMGTIGSADNVTGAEALALSLAFGTVVFLASLPGAVFWIMRPSMRKAVRSEVEHTEASPDSLSRAG
jgi:hypothetical protein